MWSATNENAMSNRPLSHEKWNAVWRARAKAERGKTTLRAKVRKRIDFLNRLYAETERVQRHYCTLFGFWRFCRVKQCHRARACRGDPDACLKRLVDKVPRQEQWQARQKLLEATPRQLGAVELKVRQRMPDDFWRRFVNPLRVEKAVAEERRRREIDKHWFDDMHPFGPDGLGPRRRRR
jgi:hypothetical protein